MTIGGRDYSHSPFLGIHHTHAGKSRWIKIGISEKALFVISIIGGAVGMLAGMLLARHKTKHWTFMVFVPLLIVAHVVIIVVWLL